MRRLFGVIVLFFAVSCGLAAQYTFRLLNNTGVALSEVYITPSDGAYWGGNLLTEEIGFMLDDEILTVTLPYSPDKVKFYDILAFDQEQHLYKKLDILIREDELVEISRHDRLAPEYR
jgi:hypothetical protein